MNFFEKLFQQPPVPDKDHNNNEQDPSDQFTVTKGKTLKGFNDDFSQIQLGSEVINDDSITEIQHSHKLLEGCTESLGKRTRRYTDKSLGEGVNDPCALNPSGYEQFGQRKDSKSSKLQLQTKQSLQHRSPAQFGGNLQRQLSISQNGTKPTKRKRLTQQLILNLAQLKRLKSQLIQLVSEETIRYRRHFQNMKVNLQNEIRKKMASYSSEQARFGNVKFTKSDKGEKDDLRLKLKEAEQLIEEYKVQINELSQENQLLQEKQFDLEQKIVGVDLEVETKFQQKKKELQKKIVEQVTKNLKSNKNLLSNNHEQNQEPINNQNNQIVQNLIKQNQFLQSKMKSYEKLLIEADQIRKMKESLEQRQTILIQKESELSFKKSQVQNQIKSSYKKSVAFNVPEETLNKQIHDLKNNLKVKEEELLKWQEELKRKSFELSQKHGSSPNNSSPKFNQMSSLSFNGQKSQEPKLNYRSPSDEEFSKKIESLNLQKVSHTQKHSRKPSDLETFRIDEDGQKIKIKSDTQRFFKQEENSVENSKKVTYDPKQHEAYEKFDREEKKKAMNQNFDNSRKHSPNFSPIFSQVNHNKTDFDTVSRDSSTSKAKMSSFKLSQHTEGKKVNADFYQPTLKNTFKYEPQFLQKPSSSPSSQHIPASRLMQNYKTVSPVNRQSAMGMFRSSQLNVREKYLQSPSDNKSTFSRSSKDNSIISYNTGKGARVAYHGYDMNKMKPKFEIGKLNDLGNKIESLKNELKNEIDTIY